MFQKLVFVQHENENKAFSTLSHSYWLEAWFEGMDSSVLFSVKKNTFLHPQLLTFGNKGAWILFCLQWSQKLNWLGSQLSACVVPQFNRWRYASPYFDKISFRSALLTVLWVTLGTLTSHSQELLPSFFGLLMTCWIDQWHGFVRQMQTCQ